MEDETPGHRWPAREMDPERPLRDPKPVRRPEVDASTAAHFARPEGIDGGRDPRGGTGPVEAPRSVVERRPDPALAQAFAPREGQERGIERHPAWQDEVAAPAPPPPDPWRDPHAPVHVGPPAREADQDRGPIDLTDAAAERPPRLSLSEVLFERRLSRQASAALAAAVALIALIGGGIGAMVADSARMLTTSTVRIADAPDDVMRPDNPIGDVAERVQPAVVNIQVSTPSSHGEGSGIVIDPQGYIVTNNHVVTAEGGAADRAAIEVVFSDGNRVPAEIVGRDPATDLAVLKVEDVQGLTVAALGDSDEVEVGEQVVAIGSPLGLARTVTEGIVSATQRPIALGESTSDGDVVIDAIQTDAAINPGNSGGPLIDATGAVIGVNTAIFTNPDSPGGSIGLGFAIPVNDVRDIVTTLMTEGSIEHPTIGVNARTAANGSVDGAEIVNVREGSAAAEGGLREGDVVTRVGERRVRSSDELVVAVRRAGTDEDVAVEVIREGSRVELTVRPTLG